MRLLREPLVHFVVAGGLLFALWSVAQRGRSNAPGVGGAGPPAVGDAARPARTVTVGTQDIQALRSSFRLAWRRDPSPGELADLVEGFIGEEMLFREALAAGLDRDDRVIRRRLVEKMTALQRPHAPNSDPPRDELQKWYQTYRHRFVKPATVTFEQVLFDGQKRGQPQDDARRALERLTAAGPTPGDAGHGGVPGGSAPARTQGAVGPDAAGTRGDPFPAPGMVGGAGRIEAKTELELAHLLGDGFARAAMTAATGTWTGPISSRFGVHLIRVVDRQPERLPPFDEVEKQVRADWLTVETRGLRGAAETLLPRYDIVLPDDLRRQLGDEPGMAPFLRRAR